MRENTKDQWKKVGTYTDLIVLTEDDDVNNYKSIQSTSGINPLCDFNAEFHQTFKHKIGPGI